MSENPRKKQAVGNHRTDMSPQRPSASKHGTQKTVQDSTPIAASEESRRSLKIAQPGERPILPSESQETTPSSPSESDPSRATFRSSQRHPSVFCRGPDERRFTRLDLLELEWDARGQHPKPSIHGLLPLDGLDVTDKWSGSGILDPKLTDLITTVGETDVVTPSTSSPLQGEKKQADKIRKNQQFLPLERRLQPYVPPSQRQQHGDDYKQFRSEKVRKQEGVFSPEYEYLEPVLEHLTSKNLHGSLEGAATQGQSELSQSNPWSSHPTSHQQALSSDSPSGGKKTKRTKRGEGSLERNGTKRKSKSKSQSDAMTTLLKLLRKSTKSAEKGDQAGSAQDDLTGRRTRTTACAFVVIFALIGALVLTTMQSIFLADSKGKMLYRCHSRECVAVKNNLMALLDENADPCEDFYGYVCRNWLKKTGAVSFIDYTIKEFHRKINGTLLSDRSLQLDKDGMHILSALYKSCYLFMTSSITSLARVVVYASYSLNISSVFHIKNSAELFTYLIEAALSKGLHTWFSIQFEYKGKKAYMRIKAETSIKRFIEDTIQEAGIGGQNYSFAERMPSYVRDVLRLLYQGKDLEFQVQQLTKWDHMIDSVLQAHSGEEYKPFTSLAPVFDPISMKYVAKMFNSMTPPNLALEPEDEILVHGYNAMADVVAIMNNGTHTSKILYFVVYLVTNVARFLFLREQVSGDPDATIGACFKVTRESLFHTWPYLITRKMKYDGRAVEARKVADGIRTSTMNSDVFRWMSKSSLRRALSDLHQLEFVVYEESKIADMNLTYQQFKITDSDFLSAYFDVKRIEAGVLMRWLPADTGHALGTHQASSLLSLHTFRVESVQRIFVPSAYQSSPMFRYHPDTVLPFYINYPTVGVLVAKEMLRAVGPPPKWDSRTRRIYREYASCLKRVRASLRLQSDMNEDDWKLESFSWSFGSRLAYEAVRSKFLSRGVEYYETYFPTAQQIYFILSCQLTCSSLQAGHVISPKEQCMLPLHSNVDFLRYYNCSERADLSCLSLLFSLKDK